MKKKRDKSNYPPFRAGYSIHHVGYPYDYYRGELEHGRYQNDPALLIQVPNNRHNLGSLALHSLIDPQYGPPPKPNKSLMLDAVDYMRALDQNEARIRRFGRVISFFIDEALENPSYHSADQAEAIANHYSMQYQIITEGGEAFIRSQQYLGKRG